MAAVFINNFVNRVLLRQRGIYSTLAPKTGSSVEFGNPLMPDKLYKNIELEIRSYEPAVMKSYQTFIKTAAQHLDVDIQDIITKRKANHKRISLLKSAFVHRKHLVQYEVRTYYSWIILKHLTGSTADTFLEYIERMLPEGVALKVTKVALEPLASHLNSRSMRSRLKVESHEQCEQSESVKMESSEQPEQSERVKMESSEQPEQSESVKMESSEQSKQSL